MSYAFLALVGPARRHLDGLREVLDGLAAYEADRLSEWDLYLADDGNPELQAYTKSLTHYRRVEVFANPGHGLLAMPWDRNLTGIYEGVRRAAGAGGYRFLLKMDTDALIIGPFIDRTERFLEESPTAGIVGSYCHFPSGKPRLGNYRHEDSVRRATRWLPRPRLVRSDPRVGYVRMILAHRRPRREIVHGAWENGHQASQHVQGGAYAVSEVMLDELRRRNWPESPFTFVGTRLGEDMAMGLLTHALGFDLMDFNRRGDVFGIWPREMRCSLDEMVERQYGIIHSVDKRWGQDEEEIRQFFRRRRMEG